MRGDKAAVYLRVSSKRQATHGFGLQLQEEDCRKYCEYKGYEVVKISQDIQSGTTLDRPGLQSLLSELDAQGIQVIVCYWIDRLSRDVEDTRWIREELSKHGVRLEFSTQADLTPDLMKLAEYMQKASS